MALQRLLKKLEGSLRRLAETPFEAPHHPLTLRRHLLDAVEETVDRTGRTQVAPGERLVLTIHPAAEASAADLEAAFVHDGRLAREVADRLRDAGVVGTEALEVEVVVEERPAAEPVEQEGGEEAPSFELRWEAAPEALPGPEPIAEAVVRLVVVKGRAQEAAYDITGKRVVNVGRLEEVVNAHGHLTRRNDVAFADEDDPLNATVSRAHAQIRFDADQGTYRLADQDSTWGTTVYRQGETGLLPVKRRGVPLRNGDLLYFGKACVRFEVGDRG